MMTLSGLGIACLPILAVEDDLKEGRLIRLTADGMSLKASVWAVHNYGLQMPARIRAFIDFVKEKAKDKL
jgi:DNA-binding transcriptional LysR family regulator